MGNILVHITMFGWIPVVIELFSKLPARRAVISAFLFAWLFLPNTSYSITGLPDYTKMTATCWGILIAALLFDFERLSALKIRFVDIPMMTWCICPLISSLSNDLGLYDGSSAALAQTVIWGFPYFIGRLYFHDLESLKEFAIGMFISALIYMPLCWYELRMSPQLHNMVYGYTQHSFVQTYRWGGWRPMVFMSHGLALGVWMMGGSLIGVWLWVSGVLKKIRNISMHWLVPSLIITFIFCKSTGAIALFLIGLSMLFCAKIFKKKLIIICLVLLPLIYLPLRSTGYWDGVNLAAFLYHNFSEERASSLYQRFYNENMLAEKALERPVLGWGGWGRARVHDEYGNDITVTDSLWIIAFGNYGFLGLLSLTALILLPITVLLRCYQMNNWFHPKLAPAAVLSILLGLYMIDCLINSMVNPIFMAIAGGMAGLLREPLDYESNTVESRTADWDIQIYQPRFL